MPRLSVVLVVHGEQAHLDEVTSAALRGDDVELVVVDDASPDHGPELLDALAARDERVRVHHLTERVGLGEARNLALELAVGEYVWFVNASDVPAPGGVLARLAETSPDVLLVGDRIEDVLGRSRRGPHAALVRRLTGTVTLDEEPGLADAAPRAWDKVFRRDGLGRFAAGRHGELTVSWPALLGARRIAAVPGTSYMRRELENATRVPGSPFEAYESVLRGADERTRRVVVPAMARHLLSLLDRIPEGERREFFRRASELYRRHRTADEPASPRHRLLERDAYAAYRLLDQGIEARRRAPSLAPVRKARGRLRKASLERHYRSRLRAPLDPELAVYGAYWFRGYACNPRAIYERAAELVPHVRGVWVVRPGATVPDGVEHVVANTPEYFDAIARAGYLVNNVNFPNNLVKREGSVHVMTHHGTPLKRMGLDLRHAHHAGRKMDFAALLERCRRWDFSVSSNRHSTLIWERVYPVPFETLEVGYPRNDALANATDADAQRLRAELGIAPGQTAVLYAPTHREYRSGYEPALDLGRLAAALGDDHVVLARQHYFYDADPLVRDLHRVGRLLDVAAHPSVEELCIASDVLLTDYSSIMFDYAVLDRPIVIHAPDWDVYRELRGTYFDLLAEPPGAVARTDDELVDLFASGAAYDTAVAEARAAFRARFASLDDGRAAERVVRRVWLGEREATQPPVPSTA
ncbi:MAG TPA: CDP-glycerol glycerophosphotransferase family protein [Solirubrobacteraceae bacterium]|nr:CDP-glycerol glycerophosphotransferase family protein [Solirubrobacteraceae bacterium]